MGTRSRTVPNRLASTSWRGSTIRPALIRPQRNRIAVDMYVEDDYAAFVRYCFEDLMDAAVFRLQFEPKVERFKLAG